jgi:hypothetical protein
MGIFMLHRFAYLLSFLFVPIFAGCTTCCHRVAFESLGNDNCPEVSGQQRNNVCAILIGPELDLGWSKLDERIHEMGFAKLLRGTSLQSPFLIQAAQTLNKENPDIRFVVISYDLGTVAARDVVKVLLDSHCHVDSAVMIDPWSMTSQLPETFPVSIVRSHGWTKGLVSNSQDITAPGVGHFDIPTHDYTISAIRLALVSSAQNSIPVKTIRPFQDPTAPPIPSSKDRPSHLGSEWDFLLGPSQPFDPKSISPKPAITIPERTASR